MFMEKEAADDQKPFDPWSVGTVAGGAGTGALAEGLIGRRQGGLTQSIYSRIDPYAGLKSEVYKNRMGLGNSKGKGPSKPTTASQLTNFFIETEGSKEGPRILRKLFAEHGGRQDLSKPQNIENVFDKVLAATGNNPQLEQHVLTNGIRDAAKMKGIVNTFGRISKNVKPSFGTRLSRIGRGGLIGGIAHPRALQFGGNYLMGGKRLETLDRPKPPAK
jgi:hypothetical protein